MPATTKLINGRWRVVHGDGKLLTNKQGTPVDGGGHKSAEKAARQAKHINAKS